MKEKVEAVASSKQERCFQMTQSGQKWRRMGDHRSRRGCKGRNIPSNNHLILATAPMILLTTLLRVHIFHFYRQVYQTSPKAQRGPSQSI